MEVTMRGWVFFSLLGIAVIIGVIGLLLTYFKTPRGLLFSFVACGIGVLAEIIKTGIDGIFLIMFMILGAVFYTRLTQNSKRSK